MAQQKICFCGAVIEAATPAALDVAVNTHNFVAHNIPMPSPVVGQGISSVAVKFGDPKEKSSMANGQMTLNQQEAFFIDGFNADGSVGVLGPGQALSASLDDPTIASLTADTAPGVDPNGVQSIGSGVATALKVGVANLTADVANADGTLAATVVAPVTVTAVMTGGITSLQIVFGPAVIVAKPVPGAASPAARAKMLLARK